VSETGPDRPDLPPMKQPQLTTDYFGKLQAKLQNFQSEFVGEPNILVIGGMGAGKSSLINGAVRVLTGKKKNVVEARPSKEAVSCELSIQLLPDVLGVGHFRLWDVWGWTGRNYGPDVLVKLLNGELRNGYRFQDNPLTGPNVRAGPLPKSEHVHAVIFVVPAQQATFGEYYAAMESWIACCRVRKLDVFVVLTRVDSIDPQLASEPSLLWASEAVNEMRHQVAEKAELNPSEIFPLKNYHDENKSVLAIDVNLAKIFLRALKSVEVSFGRHFNNFVQLQQTLDGVAQLRQMGYKQTDRQLKLALFRVDGIVNRAVDFLSFPS